VSVSEVQGHNVRSVPHTYGCGTDLTLDNTAADETDNQTNDAADAHSGAMSNVQSPPIGHDSEVQDEEPTLPPITVRDIAQYAEQVHVQYPTSNGAELYKIAEIVPRHLRTAFEVALGDAFTSYFEEVLRREQDPPERPIPDILALYLPNGFVSAKKLYNGYKHACEMGHKMAFLTALNDQNTKAVDHLKELVAGRHIREYVVIQHLPCEAKPIPMTQ